MLIVIIIGILAAAIIPKITGVMSRARDTKRIADLSNVQMAIEQYRMDNGFFPDTPTKFHECGGRLSLLSGVLSSYIPSLPQDPQKNTEICIHHVCIFKKIGRSLSSSNEFIANYTNVKGEYYYQRECRKNHKYQAILVAKTETPASSNYVLIDKYNGSSIDFWSVRDGRTQTPILCSSIKKVKKGSEVIASENNAECAYSSEDQLYYIVKIQ